HPEAMTAGVKRHQRRDHEIQPYRLDPAPATDRLGDAVAIASQRRGLAPWSKSHRAAMGHDRQIDLLAALARVTRELTQVRFAVCRPVQRDMHCPAIAG